MRQVQLINVSNNEVTAFHVLKSAAEYIESLNITDITLQTIQTKLSKALKDDKILFDTFKVVQLTTDEC